MLRLRLRRRLILLGSGVRARDGRAGGITGSALSYCLQYEGFRGFPGVKPVIQRPAAASRAGCASWVASLSAAAVLASGLAALLYTLWLLGLFTMQLPPPGALFVGGSAALAQIALARLGFRSWTAAALVVFGMWGLCVLAGAGGFSVTGGRPDWAGGWAEGAA